MSDPPPNAAKSRPSSRRIAAEPELDEPGQADDDRAGERDVEGGREQDEHPHHRIAQDDARALDHRRDHDRCRGCGRRSRRRSAVDRRIHGLRVGERRRGRGAVPERRPDQPDGHGGDDER